MSPSGTMSPVDFSPKMLWAKLAEHVVPEDPPVDPMASHRKRMKQLFGKVEASVLDMLDNWRKGRLSTEDMLIRRGFEPKCATGLDYMLLLFDGSHGAVAQCLVTHTGDVFELWRCPCANLEMLRSGPQHVQISSKSNSADRAVVGADEILRLISEFRRAVRKPGNNDLSLSLLAVQACPPVDLPCAGAAAASAGIALQPCLPPRRIQQEHGTALIHKTDPASQHNSAPPLNVSSGSTWLFAKPPGRRSVSKDLTARSTKRPERHCAVSMPISSEISNGILPPSDLIVRSFTQHSLGSSASHSSVKDLGSSLQSMVDVLIPLNLDEACVPRVPTVGMKTVAPFFDRTRNWRREMLPRNFGGADGRDSFARLPLMRRGQLKSIAQTRHRKQPHSYLRAGFANQSVRAPRVRMTTAGHFQDGGYRGGQEGPLDHVIIPLSQLPEVAKTEDREPRQFGVRGLAEPDLLWLSQSARDLPNNWENLNKHERLISSPDSGWCGPWTAR